MSFFHSLKIFDCSTVLAGPSVGTFFAELGASVIKYEHPLSPDVTRSWKLESEDPKSEVSAYFSSINYKKSYKKIDFTKENDKTEFFKKLKEIDIVLFNFKKADYSKFSLENEELWNINPRLIIGKITGYGNESDRVAYDLILQAESGFMHMNGTPESGPVKMPVALIDVLAAHQLKEGILAALLERSRDDRGREVSVSLFDAAISALTNQASNYLMEEKNPQRIGSLHPNIAPYGEQFQTQDKKIGTFAIGSQTQFEKVCRFLDLTHLVTDEKYSSVPNRVKNRYDLQQIWAEKIRTLSSNELNAFALSENIPFGIIKDLIEVFSEYKARKLVRTEEIEGIETHRITQIAFKISEK